MNRARSRSNTFRKVRRPMRRIERLVLISLTALALSGLLSLVTDGSSGPPSVSGKTSPLQVLSDLAAPVPSGSNDLIAYASNTPAAIDLQVRLYDRPSASHIPLPGINSNGNDYEPSISGDGRFIAFNRDYDILLYDRALSSLVGLPGINTDALEASPAISGDGRFIAFTRYPHGSRGGRGNIRLYDRTRSAFVRLAGLNTEAFDESSPSLSGLGRFLAFTSDRDGRYKIFLYDRHTARLVHLPNLNGPGCTRFQPALSADALLIAFTGQDPGCIPNDGGANVFLYDRSTASLVPLPGLNHPLDLDAAPALSGDGRFIAFYSGRRDFGDILLYDRVRGDLVPLPGIATAAVQMDPSLR